MILESAPLNFALDHIHWPFIVAAAWWFRGKTQEYLDKVGETHTQVTNHIPHKLDEQTELLRNMDRNIAVVASVRTERKSRVND